MRCLLDSTLNLRTIIVIADIYRGLYSPAQHINTLDPPYLTFRHRSGVTPYTSSCEFAGSCVFDKQSAGNLSLRPHYPKAARRTLSLSYGRYFAEFLEDLSLVRLSLLDSTTCVGLRYGTVMLNPNEVFLGSVLLTIGLAVAAPLDSTWTIVTRICLSNALIAPTPIQ